MSDQKDLLKKVEYFYVYVAELECSSRGYWIQLEPDKTLRLERLRGYFPTCFGIKYKLVNTSNEFEFRYIRYYNGHFLFPPALDFNNTRFVAYYYNDLEDIKAFMDMLDSNDDVENVEEMPTMTLQTSQLPSDGNNSGDSTALQLSLPAPPVTPANLAMVREKTSNIKSILEPGASDENIKYIGRVKRERITIKDSSGYKRERSSVLVAVKTIPKSRNMLDRYQKTRPSPKHVHTKTPLTVTFKGHGRQVHRNKILKIEDRKGRTTALITKKKWTEDDEFEERSHYEDRYQNYLMPEKKPFIAFENDLEVNVLLVGFFNQRPIEHETMKYFSDFGVVANIQVLAQENRYSATEYYAFMKIRTNDVISVFSDRHLYNGTIIYAIRVDGPRAPLKLTCNLCGYYGLNVGFLHYHVEGQCHQHNLQKRLESRSTDLGHKVFLDSYYRISSDELCVQYPENNVQDMVRHNCWNPYPKPATYLQGANSKSNYRNVYNSADDRERYY